MTAMPSIAELHDLTGKVAIVTGGSRGIGRAIVQTLAEAGADVVIASRKLDSCELAAEEVRTSTGRRALAVAFHAGRWDDCDRLFATTIEHFGRVDVLVNNAGTAGSLMASTRELPYACAKSGLNALTVGMADAFAPSVRVNAILPGPFLTDLSVAWGEEARKGEFVPLKRLGRPEEIGPLALHLASAASSYTTGAIIRVDGGITRKV